MKLGRPEVWQITPARRQARQKLLAKWSPTRWVTPTLTLAILISSWGALQRGLRQLNLRLKPRFPPLAKLSTLSSNTSTETPTAYTAWIPLCRSRAVSITEKARSPSPVWTELATRKIRLNGLKIWSEMSMRVSMTKFCTKTSHSLRGWSREALSTPQKWRTAQQSISLRRYKPHGNHRIMDPSLEASQLMSATTRLSEADTGTQNIATPRSRKRTVWNTNATFGIQFGAQQTRWANQWFACRLWTILATWLRTKQSTSTDLYCTLN